MVMLPGDCVSRRIRGDEAFSLERPRPCLWLKANLVTLGSRVSSPGRSVEEDGTYSSS